MISNSKQHLLTYSYLLVYILLSSGVILYNKWILSPSHLNFPYPITLTMIHMGFSAVVAFFLIRVFKVIPPIKMTCKLYLTCVVPISAFSSLSLWFGNTAYLHISVAFIQMLKALMPVATFFTAVVCGTDKLRCDVLLNVLLISVGVIISSYGEIHFNVLGTLYQVSGIFAEALKLVLTQILLQEKGLTLNPITSIYYLAPCSFVFLCIPWCFLEVSQIEVEAILLNIWIFFSNSLCALALNLSTLLAIGRTGAVTIRVAAVLKDWILISLSTVLFPESIITGLNIIGYTIALCGVIIYNYLKVRDIHASLLRSQSFTDRTAKEFMERKSSSVHLPDIIDTNNNVGRNEWVDSSQYSDADEEAELIPSSRIPHLR
ncbi:hypothetical protein ACOSQ2_000633 [Xanthoceras sorbifolium]